MSGYIVCDTCGPVYVEQVHNGVGWTFHAVHCGWGHEYTRDQLMTEAEAHAAVEGRTPPRLWWKRDPLGWDTFAILDADNGWVIDLDTSDIVEETVDALPAEWIELVPRWEAS